MRAKICPLLYIIFLIRGKILPLLYILFLLEGSLGQLGQAPEINPNSNEIPIVSFSVTFRLKMCVLPTKCMISGRRVCQHRIMGLFQRNHKSRKKLFSVSIFSLSFRVRKTWSPLPSASDSSSTTSDPDPTCSPMLLSILF